VDWRRPDGSLDLDRFLAHAMSLLGDPAERWTVDLDAVRATTVERPAWHADAACKGSGPRLIFAGSRRSAADARARYCDACPVSAQCLAAALSGDEVGVWGGSTADQRRGMRRTATGAA
jgi:hypothetical protein